MCMRGCAPRHANGDVALEKNHMADAAASAAPKTSGLKVDNKFDASSSILNPPAHTKRRSVLRQFIDAVIEGRRRKAQHELALEHTGIGE